MDQIIKEILVHYLNNKITKQQMIEIIKDKNVPVKHFNDFIFAILRKNTRLAKKKWASQREKTNTFDIKQMLDQDFIDEIKIANKKAALKTEEDTYKLNKEELRKRILLDGRINEYFYIKKRKTFDENDIRIRLKKACTEYGIEMINDDLVHTIKNGTIYYLKNFIHDKNGLLMDEKEIKDKIFKDHVILTCFKHNK